MEGKIYGAIAKVMQDVGAVGKDSVNKFDNYKYRGVDAVMNALNPAMVKNKVFVAPTVLDSHREERVGNKGTPLIYSVLTVKYTFYTDDGSSIECVVIGEAMDRSDKSTNKALAAAFKYACFQTFCIPTDEMKDSEEETQELDTKPVGEPQPDPLLQKVTPEQIAQIKAEIERTGIKESTVLATFKIKALEELTGAGFQATMHKFANTKDKA